MLLGLVFLDVSTLMQVSISRGGGGGYVHGIQVIHNPLKMVRILESKCREKPTQNMDTSEKQLDNETQSMKLLTNS